ncbi:MAG: HupE/UreJ family protein [Candidatus Methylumidiphilus sp.]
MKSTFASVVLGFVVFATLLPAAEAHTFGAHGAGWAAGFAHPFLGLDHLLAMLAVGLWAAQLGGAAVWRVPLAFVVVMLAAAGLGLAGLDAPLLEPAIASSVLVLGLLVACAVRLPTAASVGLVAVFACLHGWAHGLELPQTATPALYALGFAVATATLHGIGLGMGLATRRLALLSRLGGSAIALTGLYLLATV